MEISGSNKIELLKNLSEEYLNCKACDLYKIANQKVFGYGSVNAPIMFIGIAPGEEEDSKGIPFIGRSGKKLDNILYSLNLKKDSFYFTNLTLCRAADKIKDGVENRDPLKNEFQACFPRLLKEIYIIDPMLIIVLGKTPAKYLSRTTKEISKIRGHILDIKLQGKKTTLTYPVLPTYHPAYLLRKPSNLKKDPMHQFYTDIQRAVLYVSKYKQYIGETV